MLWLRMCLLRHRSVGTLSRVECVMLVRIVVTRERAMEVHWHVVSEDCVVMRLEWWILGTGEKDFCTGTGSN